MTRLAATGQGGRLSVRTGTTSTDSPMMATLILTGQGNSQPAPTTTGSPVRKRKLTQEEYASLANRLREHHDAKQKRLKNIYAERSALMCFLESDNNHILDYGTWRTRLPEVPLQAHLKTCRLDKMDEAEDLYKCLQVQNHSLLQSALTGNKNGQQGSQGNYIIYFLS